MLFWFAFFYREGKKKKIKSTFSPYSTRLPGAAAAAPSPRAASSRAARPLHRGAALPAPAPAPAGAPHAPARSGLLRSSAAGHPRRLPSSRSTRGPRPRSPGPAASPPPPRRRLSVPPGRGWGCGRHIPPGPGPGPAPAPGPQPAESGPGPATPRRGRARGSSTAPGKERVAGGTGSGSGGQCGTAGRTHSPREPGSSRLPPAQRFQAVQALFPQVCSVKLGGRGNRESENRSDSDHSGPGSLLRQGHLRAHGIKLRPDGS